MPGRVCVLLSVESRRRPPNERLCSGLALSGPGLIRTARPHRLQAAGCRASHFHLLLIESRSSLDARRRRTALFLSRASENPIVVDSAVAMTDPCHRRRCANQTRVGKGRAFGAGKVLARITGIAN